MSATVCRYEVSLQDVDFTKRLKIPCLFSFLLETASRNAYENNFGIQQMQKFNRSWVLSRIAVEMNKYPMQDETFSVETWVESVNRIVTARHFCVRNAADEIIGSATSTWAMIDMNTRHAVNLTDDFTPYLVDKPSLCAGVRKLPSLEGEPCCEHVVKYSDIDLNRHTNSAKYIEWLLDSIERPSEFFAKNQNSRFELIYAHEALLGETLQIYKQENAAETLFEIKRGDDSICKMRLTF